MKNLIVFFLISIINGMLDFFLYKYNAQNFQTKDFIKLLILYLFSLITYWFFFCFYFVEEKIRNKKNSISIVAIIFSVLALLVCAINIVNNPILFFPMMYIIPLLGVSIYWQFLRK